MKGLLMMYVMLFVATLVVTVVIVVISWKDPVKGNKKPWLAALLVYVFGPFGFLYYSWKLTIAFLVPVVWIGLKQILFFGGAIVVYPVVCIQMAMLAAFAFVDVMRRSKMRPL